MALPWLGLIDTLLDVSSLVLTKRSRRPAETPESLPQPGPALGHLEARLAGVVVAALKEAFDRDTRRLELEREQLERERAQAERLLKLELMRQAGDREIGRLRLMAGVALGSCVGALVVSIRLIGGPIGARTLVGAGWVLLLVALSLSFTAQARVGRALTRLDETALRHDDVATGTAGGFVPWLIVAGLAVIGVAVLMA